MHKALWMITKPRPRRLQNKAIIRASGPISRQPRWVYGAILGASHSSFMSCSSPSAGSFL